MSETEWRWKWALDFRVWAIGIAWTESGSAAIHFGPLRFERTEE